MSKEWLDWVRNSVGYKDESLTAAHYEKLSRVPTKEIFEFLQKHIKSEEEILMIKENIALFYKTDADVLENESASSNEHDSNSIDEETSQTLLEIQLAEERIKKLEMTIANRGNQQSERSNESIDLQRRTTLIKGIVEHSERELKTINNGVKELEAFTKSIMAKKDFRRKSNINSQIECNGCKKSDASILMQNLCKSLDESKDLSKTNQSHGFDVKELVKNHNSECIFETFMNICGIALVKDNSIRLDTTTEEKRESYIQALQRQHMEIVGQSLSLMDQKKRVDSAVEEVVKKLDGTGSNANGEMMSEWINTQLTMANLRGACDWLSGLNDKRSMEIGDEWHKEQLDLKKDVEELEVKCAQLQSLEASVENSLIKACNTLKEVFEMETEAQNSLSDFVINCKELIALNTRFALSNDTREQCSTMLNSIKAGDIFTSSTRDDLEMGDLFVPNIDQPNAILSCVRQGTAQSNVLAGVLKDLWESVDVKDNECVQDLLNELKTKETEYRNGAVAELILKLKSSEGITMELELCLGRLKEIMDDWSLDEAKNN